MPLPVVMNNWAGAWLKWSVCIDLTIVRSSAAAVELSKQASTDEAALIDFVKSRLDSVKAPKRIYVTDALPRSPVGKVLRREAKLVFADY